MKRLVQKRLISNVRFLACLSLERERDKRDRGGGGGAGAGDAGSPFIN